MIIVVVLIVGTAVAVGVLLLGPASPPKSQTIGAVEVSIVGLDENPLYGNLFDFDAWEVIITTNSYSTNLAMRPLIKIQGLTDCTKITLQVSLDGSSWASVVVSGGVCEGDPTATYNRNVLAGATGDKWFFRHRFASDFSQFGDTLQFTAQMVQ